MSNLARVREWVQATPLETFTAADVTKGTGLPLAQSSRTLSHMGSRTKELEHAGPREGYRWPADAKSRRKGSFHSGGLKKLPQVWRRVDKGEM